MTDRSSLGHWIRRFLLEYATSERNLSANTCASYRDMLVLLLPYLAKRKCVATDALLVTDLSAELVRSFLVYLEQERECCTATRNQRLASIHALRTICFSRPWSSSSIHAIHWYGSRERWIGISWGGASAQSVA
jgi:site-specific recombinase XerD